MKMCRAAVCQLWFINIRTTGGGAGATDGLSVPSKDHCEYSLQVKGRREKNGKKRENSRFDKRLNRIIFQEFLSASVFRPNFVDVNCVGSKGGSNECVGPFWVLSAGQPRCKARVEL